MAGEIMSSGERYAYDLLTNWNEIIHLSEQMRELEMNRILRRSNTTPGKEERDAKAQYIAKLTRIWLELSITLQERTEFKVDADAFLLFRKYYRNPSLLEKPENIEALLDMESSTRTIIEKLGITRFERSL